MPLTLPDAAKSLLFELIAVPVIFVAMHAFGRWLKRSRNVRLGISYKLFCAAVALYIPCLYIRVPFPWQATLTRHLSAAVLILGTFFLLALVRRFFWEGWFESAQRVRAPKFLSQLVALFIFLGAVLAVLGGIYGLSIQGAVFGSTVVLGIIGFAMQDLLGNIIAGVALELGKPFRIGDWLIVETHRAEVIEVNWRSTRVRTNDGVYLDIPNKTIVGATITNLTFPNREHAVRLVIGFEYATAPNSIKDMLVRAAEEVPGVLAAPPPKAFLKEFAESAVQYEIKFWMEDESRFNDIVDGIRTNVWYAAQRANVRIPFPIRTVRLERPGARQRDALAAAEQSARNHPILQLLDEPQMTRLLRQARLARFGRGEHVIGQGDGGQSMFILLDGEADVFVRSNGTDTQVATLRAGDYCGEMSLLTGEPRSATVIARTDCQMWEIDKNVMGELLRENAALVQRLSEVLAQRRMQTEGALARQGGHAEILARRQEYADGFLKKLSSFFDL
jgi:small-conductance mechanosensitive channel/CRP-like cAMP-binding protein